MTWEQRVESDFHKAQHLIRVLEEGHPVNIGWMAAQIRELAEDASLRLVEVELLRKTVRSLEDAFAQYLRKHPQSDDQADIALGIEP